MKRKEGLIETIKSGESVREGWLKAFSKQVSGKDLKWGAGIVWYDHERFALKSFFIEDSLTETKQHFYTCGRLDEYLINNYDGRILEYGISNISYALLSDHQDLIRRYADLAHPGYEKITKKGSLKILTPCEEAERHLIELKAASVKLMKFYENQESFWKENMPYNQ